VGFLRVLFILFASILVDAAGPIGVSSATEVIEEFQEEEASRHRRTHAARPHREAANSPFAVDLAAATQRPRPAAPSPRRPDTGHRILKVPPLVAESSSAPEDH
jgi:hypothetical protein